MYTSDDPSSLFIIDYDLYGISDMKKIYYKELHVVLKNKWKTHLV